MPATDTRYTIETSRWSSALEGEIFQTRKAAIDAVKAELSEMYGGWRTCPDSHGGGCKWRNVSAYEWEGLGFDTSATDRWMHSTRRTDIFHRERIYVRPLAEGEQ